MEQQTFAEISFEQYRKQTRRKRFLDEMNRIVPWAERVAVMNRCIPRPKAQGTPGWRRTHAASPLIPTVVQFVGSSGGGSAG